MNPNPLYSAVIFDLDGTLADTIGLIVSSFNAACREPLGRDLSADEVIALFGIPDEAMLRRELQSFPPEVVNAAVQRFFAHYESEHDSVHAFEGINEVLQTLHARGVPLGIVTGKGRRSAEITLRKLGWIELFGSIVTGEDIEQQKPHPAPALHAAKELNAAPETCLFIGDSPADIGAGRAAGMKTIAVLWHGHYREKLKNLSPDYWAETTEELAAILGVG